MEDPATVAAVIASQAVISGVFSIARQAMQLGYLPRLTVMHTSESEIGQIYIPFLNWLLLGSVLTLALLFHSSSELAAAYGIAVTMTMICDTLLVAFLMYNLWHWSLPKVLLIAIPFLILTLLTAIAAAISARRDEQKQRKHTRSGLCGPSNSHAQAPSESSDPTDGTFKPSRAEAMERSRTPGRTRVAMSCPDESLIVALPSQAISSDHPR